MGGERLDQSFLADLPVAPGMKVGLYSDAEPDANANPDGTTRPVLLPVSIPRRLVGATGEVPGAARYQPLIDAAIKTGQQTSGLLYLTSRREDSVNATAIPLKNESGAVLAVLTVAISRPAWWRRNSTSGPLPMAWRLAGFCWPSSSACGLRRASRGPSSSWRARPKRWPAATGRRGCPTGKAAMK